MSRKLYVIYDKVAEEAGPVFEAANDEKARRSVWQLLRRVVPYDRDSFELICLGMLDVGKDNSPSISLSAEGVVSIDIPRFLEAEEEGTLRVEVVENESK